MKKGRLTVRFTDAFRRAAGQASVDLDAFELVQGRNRVGLVGQDAFEREAGRVLPRGHLFWPAMAFTYLPVDGELVFHFDGKRFDWGHKGKKRDEDHALLYERVRARFERRPPAPRYRAKWTQLQRAFGRLSPDERRARGDAAQLECAFATQNAVSRGEREVTRYLNAAERTYEWKQRAVTVDDLLALNATVTGRKRARVRDFEAAITGKNELQYVGFKELPRAMEELVEFVEGSSWTPVEVAASAYQRFCSIHPFEDGNGRTGRLILNGLLHRDRFPPVALRGKEQLVAIYGTHARGRNFSGDRALSVVTRGMERAVLGKLVQRGHGVVLK